MITLSVPRPYPSLPVAPVDPPSYRSKSWTRNKGLVSEQDWPTHETGQRVPGCLCGLPMLPKSYFADGRVKESRCDHQPLTYYAWRVSELAKELAEALRA